MPGSPARHRPALLVILIMAVLALGACGGPSSTTAPPPTSSGVTKVVRVARFPQVRADILVTDGDFALYIFVPDKRRAVTCGNLCQGTWPPVFEPTVGAIAAGAGVDRRLLGSDPDPATGKRVVTYNGWPLYRYVADPQPGYASGQAVDLTGGYWYVMRPSGQPVVPSGHPPPVPSP